MRRKETLRGVRGAARQIDPKRVERAGRLNSQAELGNDLGVDTTGRLRTKGVAKSVDLEPLAKDIAAIKKALGLETE